MYAKNIATAAQSFLAKEAPTQKVDQWKRDRRGRKCATSAKVRQLKRLFRYQLAATNGQLKGWRF